MSVLLTVITIVLILSTPQVLYDIHHDMTLIISSFYIISDICYYVLCLQPGEWSAAGHGHPPVLVSVTEYIGNITYFKCPYLFFIPSFTYYCCHVDSTNFIYLPLAPND